MHPHDTGLAAVNGTTLAYDISGQGFPLVLAHAGIADRRMWDDQLAAFAARYQVVRFDQRGFGQSSPASGAFARHEDLRALLDHLAIPRAHLLGASMGGTIMLDFALAYPERVRSLTVVGSRPAGFQFDAPPPRQAADLDAAYEAGDASRASALEVEIWVDGPHRTPDQVPAPIRDRIYAMNLPAIQNELQHEADEQRLAPPAAERLAEVAAPTLVISGDLDTPASVAGAGFIARSVPRARQIVMDGTAHLPNLERPAEFAQHVLDFLATV